MQTKLLLVLFSSIQALAFIDGSANGAAFFMTIMKNVNVKWKACSGGSWTMATSGFDYNSLAKPGKFKVSLKDGCGKFLDCSFSIYVTSNRGSARGLTCNFRAPPTKITPRRPTSGTRTGTAVCVMKAGKYDSACYSLVGKILAKIYDYGTLTCIPNTGIISASTMHSPMRIETVNGYSVYNFIVWANNHQYNMFTHTYRCEILAVVTPTKQVNILEKKCHKISTVTTGGGSNPCGTKYGCGRPKPTPERPVRPTSGGTGSLVIMNDFDYEDAVAETAEASETEYPRDDYYENTDPVTDTDPIYTNYGDSYGDASYNYGY